MKQSAKRFISSVVSLLFIVGSFVTFFNFVQPAYREVLDLKGTLASLESFKTEQDAAVKDIQALVGTYNNSQEVRDTVSLALPLSPSLAEAVAQVNGLVVNNNLSAQSYGLSPISEPVLTEEVRRQLGTGLEGIVVQPVSPINFNIRLTGSYEDFKSFLAQLQTNVRVFDVKIITIQPAAQPDENLYFYDLTVATYYQYHE